MQYKIPVQIENEDPIILWLGLRQLTIIMIWGGIAYTIFKGLAPSFWGEVALIPSIFILLLFIIVAIFKQYEMTFIPFLLSLLRFNINSKNRKWEAWIDSFQSIDIWYVQHMENKKEEKIDFKSKMDKIKELEWKIEKI